MGLLGRASDAAKHQHAAGKQGARWGGLGLPSAALLELVGRLGLGVWEGRIAATLGSGVWPGKFAAAAKPRAW